MPERPEKEASVNVDHLTFDYNAHMSCYPIMYPLSSDEKCTGMSACIIAFSKSDVFNFPTQLNVYTKIVLVLP